MPHGAGCSWETGSEGAVRARSQARIAAAPLTSRRARLECVLRSDAGWSSPVARWAHNPKVAGSNPAPATMSAARERGRPFTWGTTWSRPPTHHPRGQILPPQPSIFRGGPCGLPTCLPAALSPPNPHAHAGGAGRSLVFGGSPRPPNPPRSAEVNSAPRFLGAWGGAPTRGSRSCGACRRSRACSPNHHTGRAPSGRAAAPRSHRSS